jgi:hypothetical protein
LLSLSHNARILKYFNYLFPSAHILFPARILLLFCPPALFMLGEACTDLWALGFSHTVPVVTNTSVEAPCILRHLAVYAQEKERLWATEMSFLYRRVTL